MRWYKNLSYTCKFIQNRSGADTCPCPAWKMQRAQHVTYLQTSPLTFLYVDLVLPPRCTRTNSVDLIRSTSPLVLPPCSPQNRRPPIRTVPPAAAPNPSLPATSACAPPLHHSLSAIRCSTDGSVGDRGMWGGGSFQSLSHRSQASSALCVHV